jgi:omega-amidase
MTDDIKLKVSLLQMDIAYGDPVENRKRVDKMLKKALDQPKKPDIIVLPEMWNTGFNFKKIRDIADREGDPSIKWLCGIAKQNRVNIVAGSIADIRTKKSEDEEQPCSHEPVYNSAYIIDRQGSIKARYDKIHLFRPMSEDKFVTAGQEAATFEIDGITCGIIICYDLRFPEIARKLALKGAKIIFVPAQWPMPRETHWKLLNIVRSIENQCFMVAVNRTGKDEHLYFPGMSVVVNPFGDVLIEGEGKPDVLTTMIDINVVDSVRGTFSVLEDRRPETYS